MAKTRRGGSAVVKLHRLQSRAVRRTVAGHFTRQSFKQIGGKDCPRFTSMTWKERDAFMAKPEGQAVRERYEQHLKNATKAAAAA